MRTSVVNGHALVEHFRALGCRVTVDSLSVKVARLTHVEDAEQGTLSWYRGGELPTKFAGDVLVARSDASIDGAAGIVAYHDNPRMVLRKTILKYGFHRFPLQTVEGPRCRIHLSAVIGAEGQSYEMEDGRWIRFPHAGGVRLGTEVDVNPCATLMRGSIGDTVVGDGSKIGNGVNVGHDVRIGKNVLMIQGVLIAGWVRIGDGAKIWQGAVIKNGIQIGAGAEIGMGAVVLTDVPAGEVWAANPARRIR